MNMKTRNTKMSTAIAESDLDDAELAALLADIEVEDELEADAEANEDTIEVSEASADEEFEAELDAAISDEELEAAVNSLELDEARSEAYESQEATDEGRAPELAEGEVEAKAETKAKRAPRKTMTGHRKSEVVLDKLGEGSHEYFALEIADAELSQEELKAKQEEMLAEIDKMAKKIGEKAVNMLSWLAGKSKLSNYTVQAIALLIDKGELVSKDLVEHYKARPYSEGTARSQSQQLMKLLPAMKVATTDGRTLRLNPESLIVAKFQEAVETE